MRCGETAASGVTVRAAAPARKRRSTTVLPLKRVTLSAGGPARDRASPTRCGASCALQNAGSSSAKGVPSAKKFNLMLAI